MHTAAMRCSCVLKLAILPVEAGRHVASRYVGLTNLGSSCYMNSVLQMLWSLPAVQQRYSAAAPAIFKSAPPDAASDFPTQVCACAAGTWPEGLCAC